MEAARQPLAGHRARARGHSGTARASRLSVLQLGRQKCGVGCGSRGVRRAAFVPEAPGDSPRPFPVPASACTPWLLASLHPQGQHGGIPPSPQSVSTPPAASYAGTPVSQQAHPGNPGSGPQQAPNLTSATWRQVVGSPRHRTTRRSRKAVGSRNGLTSLGAGGWGVLGRGPAHLRRAGEGQVLAGHAAVAAAHCHPWTGTRRPHRLRPDWEGLGPGA